MDIHLVSLSGNTAVSSFVLSFAKSRGWAISIHAPHNPELGTSPSFTFLLVIVDWSDPNCFQQFIAWYKGRKSSPYKIIKYVAFDTAYDGEKALSAAGLYDVEYALLPPSEDALYAYLEQAAGCGEKFRHVAHSLSASVYSEIVDLHALTSITDAQGVITRVNQKFIDISGYTREELIGNKHNILKSGKHPAEFYTDMWRTISAGICWRGTICNRKKNGDYYWVDSFIFPIKDASNAIRAYASFRYEITNEIELKNRLILRDERVRISHDFANVGTWDWNIVTGDLHWSEEIHKLFGYQNPVLETTYENFLNAIHPDDRDLVTSRVNESVHSGSLYSVEHRVIHPNGDIRWLSERGRVMHDDKGNPIRMLGVVSDIHELIEAKKEALAAEKIKSTFISTLSHEIRNPLSAALGFSRIISDLAKDSEISQYGAKIVSIINHVSGIIDDIDLNNRLETNEINHALEPVKLNKIIEESIEIVASKSSTIAIHQQLIEGYVLADTQHLRQVIINLLSNALKYNRKNGSVYIRTWRTEHSSIRIEIEDTGYGIDKKNVEKLFTPYERLKWANSEIDGLGLGLSICKGLIEGMAGKIGVTSKLDEGSTFWLELPETYSTRSPSDSSQSTDVLANILPLRVLVLDDDEFIREFMKVQLENLGVTVELAADGMEGLNKIENEKFDLIITDMNMPVSDGKLLIMKMRNSASEITRKTPVIVITADTREHNELLSLGVSACLPKPVDKDSLVAILTKVVSHDKAPLESVQDPILDETVLRHHLGNNPLHVSRLLSIYLDSLKVDFIKIQLCVEQRDFTAVRKLAHKSCSPAKSVGAIRLANKLAELETMVDDAHADGVAALLSSIVETYQSTADAIGAIISANKSIPESNSRLQSTTSAPALPSTTESYSILAIDDDEFTLRQLEQVLSGFKSIQLQTEIDAKKGLELLKHNNFDILMLDLNMPVIDGVQFIRYLAARQSHPAIILYSNETSIINSVSGLISSYGMDYVGALQKPCTQLSLSRLLKSFKKAGNKLTETASTTSDELIADCIEHERVLLMYQPQISVRRNKVTSVEALSRLYDSEGKIITPYEFLPRLEELGLESTFSALVARKAIMQLSQWQAQGMDMKVAINFSMNALEDIDLPDHLNSICTQYHVERNSIIVEVTESALSSRPKLALEVLARLRLSGFTLSIDDFGTGYSSLEKLQKLPFSEIKLDRSYVSNANSDDISRALLTSSINLANQLNLTTVAEGVETESDYNLMVKLGVDLIQGYYFAKPLLPDALRIWLNEFHHARQ